MMTDTQTAFVLVPREPSPPESEIGPVAWRGDAQDGARKFTAIQRVAEIWSEQRLAVQPLYPQARIDADAAIIAALRAEVERLQECAATWEHNWKSERDVKLDCISRVKAADARAEAADARVKELEEALEPFADFADFLAIETEGFSDTDELRLFLDESDFELYRLKVASFRRARAALASKKETVDE